MKHVGVLEARGIRNNNTLCIVCTPSCYDTHYNRLMSGLWICNKRTNLPNFKLQRMSWAKDKQTKICRSTRQGCRPPVVKRVKSENVKIKKSVCVWYVDVVVVGSFSLLLDVSKEVWFYLTNEHECYIFSLLLLPGLQTFAAFAVLFAGPLFALFTSEKINFY